MNIRPSQETKDTVGESVALTVVSAILLAMICLLGLLMISYPIIIFAAFAVWILWVLIMPAAEEYDHPEK